MSRPLDTLEEADFARHLRTVFRLHLPDGARRELLLMEVTGHPYLPPATGRRRGFSLVFRSEEAGHVPQAIYRLDHDQMGSLELFLVPIGPRDGGMCYEAVFN
jgi:hypothetical protein